MALRVETAEISFDRLGWGPGGCGGAALGLVGPYILLETAGNGWNFGGGPEPPFYLLLWGARSRVANGLVDISVLRLAKPFGGCCVPTSLFSCLAKERVRSPARCLAPTVGDILGFSMAS